jgi:hypothetical protein
MPDSYVRWLEFQHTPLPKLYNNPGSKRVLSKLNARIRATKTPDNSLQIYRLMTYRATESSHKFPD